MNDLADRSELYIFSDAPVHGNEEKVQSVRDYIKTINRFKKVHIIERENNDRVANNRNGTRMLLDRFGKMIYLEEDVVTAPGFLTFINQALDKYDRNDRIFSISGYTPPISISNSYQHDVFLLRRFNAWGFGIWKNRLDQMRYVSPDEYECFAANKMRVKEFVEAGGEDMMRMLKRDAYGEIDAGDVKMMYAQFLSGQYTIYPSKSLVQNIGHDGTGIHCIKSDRFNVTLSDKMSFQLPDEPMIDPSIVKANYLFRRVSFTKNLSARVLGKMRRLIRKLP